MRKLLDRIEESSKSIRTWEDLNSRAKELSEFETALLVLGKSLGEEGAMRKAKTEFDKARKGYVKAADVLTDAMSNVFMAMKK